MDVIGQLHERVQIEELKARYCRLLDEKDWDSWEALFTEDAVLATAGSSTHGKAAIRDMVAAAMEGIPSSHQAFLPEITVNDDGTARGTWGAMFIQANGRTTGVGHYHESYRKVDGRWLIEHCDLVTAFVEGTAVPSELELP